MLSKTNPNQNKDKSLRNTMEVTPQEEDMVEEEVEPEMTEKDLIDR